jgi:hypothetical protein
MAGGDAGKATDHVLHAAKGILQGLGKLETLGYQNDGNRNNVKNDTKCPKIEIVKQRLEYAVRVAILLTIKLGATT